MADYSSIVILCEDRQQEVFARHFLISSGIDPHRIRPYTCPPGRQSGEQYVRINYPKHVISYRKKCNHIEIGLVIITDADMASVADKLSQLDQALLDENIPARQSKEKIGIFVPKRNIETWIHYLMKRDVNETDRYEHFRGKESICKPYVEELAKKRRALLSANTPPSLNDACNELERIL